MMKRSFKRKTTKRTQVKLSPKEAETVIKQEFEDSKGNMMNIKIDVTPHNPNKPTIEWNREYKD